MDNKIIKPDIQVISLGVGRNSNSRAEGKTKTSDVEVNRTRVEVFQCPKCQLFLNDFIKFMVHVDDHIDVNTTGIFYTADGSWKLNDLPNNFDIFTPRVLLEPLEATRKHNLTPPLPPPTRRRSEPGSELGCNGHKTRDAAVESSSRRSKCHFCGLRLNSIEKKREHCRECPMKPEHMCWLCNCQLATANTLKAHMELYHETTKKYKCHACSSRFATLRSVRKHWRNTGCEPNMQKCLKNVTSIDGITIIKSKSANACPVCGRVIIRRTLRDIHIKNCKNMTKPSFACWYSCSANFKSAEELAHHVQIFHIGELKYKCEHCEKPIATLECLKRHLVRSCLKKLKKGQAIKKYEAQKELSPNCTYCGKYFSKRRNLRSHMRYTCIPKQKQIKEEPEATPRIPDTENYEKSCFCRICGKGFQNFQYLRYHLTAVCLYKAPMNNSTVNPNLKDRKSCKCGMTFFSQGTLRRHQRFCCRLFRIVNATGFQLPPDARTVTTSAGSAEIGPPATGSGMSTKSDAKIPKTRKLCKCGTTFSNNYGLRRHQKLRCRLLPILQETCFQLPPDVSAVSNSAGSTETGPLATATGSGMTNKSDARIPQTRKSCKCGITFSGNYGLGRHQKFRCRFFPTLKATGFPFPPGVSAVTTSTDSTGIGLSGIGYKSDTIIPRPRESCECGMSFANRSGLRRHQKLRCPLRSERNEFTDDLNGMSNLESGFLLYEDKHRRQLTQDSRNSWNESASYFANDMTDSEEVLPANFGRQMAEAEEKFEPGLNLDPLYQCLQFSEVKREFEGIEKEVKITLNAEQEDNVPV